MVVLVIVALNRVSYVLSFGDLSGAVYGILMELEELTVIVAVPLMLGLVWNRWAGGASGFLMGSIYALYWANSFHGIQGSGTVLIAYRGWAAHRDSSHVNPGFTCVEEKEPH